MSRSCHRLRRRVASIVIAGSVAGAQLPAQVPAQVPVQLLPPPDVEFAEPFSAMGVGALRELRDGRVIVADARERLLHLVDLARGSARTLAQEGSGPREFGSPNRLLPIAGDSTLVYDLGNQRYLLLDHEGNAVTTWRPSLEGAGGGRLNLLTPARGSDAAGRLYVEAPPAARRDGSFATEDSAAILRMDRRSGRVDTMAFVRVAGLRSSVRDGRRLVTAGGGNPLTPRDEWAVFPDGRVAIARHAPYRIDFVLPDGSVRRSAPIPFTPRAITQADKDEEEERRRLANLERMNQSIRLPDGSTIAPGRLVATPPLENFPATKPPFRAGYGSVLARPNGELWVRRLEPAGARGVLYDMIDATGALLHQVRLEERTAVVGFGVAAIYTGQVDRDGLVTLRRHR